MAKAAPIMVSCNKIQKVTKYWKSGKAALIKSVYVFVIIILTII